MSDPYAGAGKKGPIGPGGTPNSTSSAGPPPGGTGDTGPGPSSAAPPYPPQPPFPWRRVFYAIGFAIIAWVMFWLIVLLLAPLHFITLAITGRPNDELKHMCSRAVRYLEDLLLFIGGVRDETPFPLGPFPKD